MKILLFNHLLSDYSLERGGRAAHAVAGREWGLAKGFAELGHETHILTGIDGLTEPRETAFSNLKLNTPWLLDPDSFDVVMLLESSSWFHLMRWKDRGEHPKAVKLLEHPFICAYLDGMSEADKWAAKKARLIAKVTKQNLRRQGADFPESPPTFQCQWAAPKGIKLEDSPYVEGSKNIIFHGCMKPRYVKCISRLARGFDGYIWIAALFIDYQQEDPTVLASTGDVSISGYGLTEAGKKKLFPYDNIKFISEDMGYNKFGIGPVLYGRYWSYLQHADLGLCFSSQSVMSNAHVKIWDYLGAGLPIIQERGCADDKTVQSFGGKIVRRDDPKALLESIQETLNREFDKNALRERIQAEHTWYHRAKLWLEKIEEVEIK